MESRIQSAVPREERKIVSVVFVDLVDFVRRGEQLDPEDLRSLLAPYYARLRTELERFGGTVEKFIGDAVMAVFGAPVAHEDDAERAVRAGLLIIEAIEELNEAHPETELAVRAAVTTGEALVALGSRPELGEGMVTGDVVNTASRLQQAGRAGVLVVDEATHRVTRDVVDYAPLEPINVKGKAAAPIAIWAARSLREPVERADVSPLVGREHELALLTGSLWTLFELGDWDAVLPAAREIVAWAPSSYMALLVLSYEAQARFHRGDLPGAVALSEEFLPRARAHRDSQVLVAALTTAAQIEAGRGDLPAAVALIEELGEETGDQVIWRAHQLSSALRVCLATGATALAEHLVDSSIEHPAARFRHGMQAARAVLAEAQGAFDHAAAEYSDVAERWAQYAPFYVTKCGHFGLAERVICDRRAPKARRVQTPVHTSARCQSCQQAQSGPLKRKHARPGD